MMINDFVHISVSCMGVVCYEKGMGELNGMALCGDRVPLFPGEGRRPYQKIFEFSVSSVLMSNYCLMQVNVKVYNDSSLKIVTVI